MPERKQRTSGVTFRIDSKRIRTNSDGSITIGGTLTRTGVFDYLRGDAHQKELRSDAEVFDEASLLTLQGVGVTVEHPQEFLSLDNLDRFQVGVVSHVEPRPDADPPRVDGSMRIWGAEAVHMVKTGRLTETSCGYGCLPVELTGDEADVSQTGIEYNHVALLPEGASRLGTQLRLDQKDNEVLPERLEEMNMDEIREALEPVLEALKGLGERMDAQEAARAKEPEPEENPVKRFEDLPNSEKIETLVAERVDNLLKMELEARDAHQAFFPDDYIEPKPCARKLCEDVLRTLDEKLEIEADADITPLVQKAALLAKQKRADAARHKPTIDSIAEQLRGGVPARLLDHESDHELPAALR